MLAKLFNADTSAFVLNYDQDGNYQDNFTADEVFPVLFDVADETTRKAILKRLLEPDFITPVGLRTISTADSWYFPSHGFGLLGGVWPDLTLWFAVALARNGAYRHAVHFLEVIYASMEAGTARNTVPGQFGEWFDGGSLTNRGMYLSPWTGAKYLWAVAETVCGIDGYRTSAASTSCRACRRSGTGPPPRACIGAAIAIPTSWIMSASASSAICRTRRPTNRTRSFTPAAT